MANWTRLTAPAAGAFSTSWITKIGIVAIAVFVGGGLLFQSCFSTTGNLSDLGDSILTEVEGVADGRATVQLGARVQDIVQRTALDDAAAARQQLAAQAQQLVAGHVTPAFNATTGEPAPEGTAPVIVPLTDDEAQLREVLRLEAIEAAHAVAALDAGGVLGPPARSDRVDAGRRARPGRRDRAPAGSRVADGDHSRLASPGCATAGRRGRDAVGRTPTHPPPVSPLGAPPTATVPHGDSPGARHRALAEHPPRMGAAL